jgi:GNAT superfamily N-acetyltransferase
MIGTVSAREPDPALADRIRSAVAPDDEGARAYLRIGARLDVVSEVRDEPGAVAWLSLHATWDRPWIIAMGQDPEAVARCVVALVDAAGPPTGVTVERRAFTHLPARMRPVEHWEWDWWYTTSPPAVRPGEDRVIGLDPGDPRIPALLAVASPDAMIRPGDPRIRGWWAIPAASVDADRAGSHDELVAVAAVTSMRAGIPHLGSVATHPGWRGQGLSRDLCARLTRDALAGGAPAVTLGMHAANRSARAVYTSLGYAVGQRWASGRLAAGTG